MATSYTVTATRLYLLRDGVERRYLRGDSVSDLTEEEVSRFKDAGAITSAGGKAAKAAKDDPEVLSALVTGEQTDPVSHEPEGGSASTLAAIANSRAYDDLIEETTLPAIADDEAEDEDDDADGADEPSDDDAPVLPPDAATKARWVAYAKAVGWSDADLEGHTRDTLRDHVKSGSAPAPFTE